MRDEDSKICSCSSSVFRLGYLLIRTSRNSNSIQRVYVDSQAVKVVQEGILISTDKGLVRVKTLRSDEKGIYVFEKELEMTEKWPTSALFRCPYRNCTKRFLTYRALEDHLRNYHDE